MLSKFFPALKPKEYSVQVLRDSTSQSAVKRIKRTRTSAPFRKIAVLTLALTLAGGGLASATAATAVSANQAQANIISDSVCVSGDSKEAGAWNGGADLGATIGGAPMLVPIMNGIHSNTRINDQAYQGDNSSWGGPSAPSDGRYLTAYEKYGMKYPIFDSWKPVYAEKEVTISQVDSSLGVYSTADGKMPIKGTGTKMTPGSSPLITSDIGACLAIMPAMAAGVANMISIMPRMVMLMSIELYGAAYGSTMSEEGSVLYEIGKNIDKFITQNGGLRDTLFIPFLLPLLLIGAIWVGYVGIVKRAAMQAVQSTAWMLCAIALGTVFLAQPTLLSSYSDHVVGQMQGVINESVTQGSLANDMCELYMDKVEPGGFQRSVRESKCTIWHSTIYTTWIAGQFGTGAQNTGNNNILTQEAGRDVLGTDAYVVWYGSDRPAWAQSWPQFMLDRQATHRTPELTEVAWAQLSGAGGASVNSAWAGNMDMISAATIMFFGAGASSAVLFVYGFALLLYQLTMVMAVLMSPFFFLFGIVPNWGRRVLMRYAEILVSLVVKRIITSLMLAFYLLFYNLIIGDASANLQIVKTLIIFALALFFITSRGKFVGLFADNINFGGNKSVGLPGNKAAAVTAGVGVGLLGGGLIGGIVVGSKVRKANKSTEGNVKDLKLEGGNPTADIKTPPRGPNSTGTTSSGASPTKVVGKAINTAEDANRVKNLVDNAAKKKAKSASSNGNNVQTETITETESVSFSETTQGSQGASNASNGATPKGAPTTPPTGAPSAGGAGASSGGSTGTAGAAGKASQAASGGAGQAVAPAGARVAGKVASSGATSAGAGATVAPVAAGGSAAGAAGIVSGGAAAGGSGVAVGGSVGISAGGAAAGGAGVAVSGTVGVAAGGAAAAGTGVAAGGAVAAGAAAGSVVPVVGTAIGAAAGAAAIAVANKKKAEESNGGE